MKRCKKVIALLMVLSAFVGLFSFGASAAENIEFFGYKQVLCLEGYNKITIPDQCAFSMTMLVNGNHAIYAKSGDSVVFSLKKGYQFENGYKIINDSTGEEVVSYALNGAYTFIMPDSSVTIKMNLVEVKRSLTFDKALLEENGWDINVFAFTKLDGQMFYINDNDQVRIDTLIFVKISPKSYDANPIKSLVINGKDYGELTSTLLTTFRMPNANTSIFAAF